MKYVKAGASLILATSTCFAADARIHAQKMAQHRENARREFWRPSHVKPPDDIAGTKLFTPRMDFPTTTTTQRRCANKPWEAINFKDSPKEYLDCLLEICLDSNVEIDFDMSDKTENIW